VIPVDQTLFGMPDGNCMAASVASVLELPLEAVPNLARLDWLPTLASVADEHGFCLRVSAAPPPGHAIACGDGPRGFMHAVVVEHGRTVHDPHYERAGLVNVHHYVSFVPCGW
jgi:hypothetical protein